MWNLDRFSDRVAIVTEKGCELTYSELHEKSTALAAFIPERCLVFCLCKNEAGSLLGYITFINNFIVPLLLDFNTDNDVLANLMDQYKPDYIWIPDSKIDEFPCFTKVCAFYEYSLMKTGYLRTYPLNPLLALLLSTSGSTGSFKLVRLSYKNIEANTQSIVEYLQLDENENPITSLPMHYTYGLSVINSHLFVGARIILTSNSIISRVFWEKINEYKVTSISGVPLTYEMLDSIRFTKMELPFLRTLTQAGGRLSCDMHKKFAAYAQKNGKRFVVMYGQTEATARMSYLPPERSLNKIGSVGIVIPGGRIELYDEQGEEITEYGVTGEIVYKGPNVSLGYASCGKDLSLGDERKGILHTGDLAKKDEDGYLYIVGRKERFIKIFGNRIYLEEVERLVENKFKEANCACTGTDDTLNVFITNASILQEVRIFIATKTRINYSRINVQFINAIPKNRSGKTQYSCL